MISSPLMRALGTTLLCLPVLLFLPGCGNLTAGGFSEVSVEVVGDSDNAASVAGPVSSGPAAPGWGGEGSDAPASTGPAASAFQGEVTVDLRVFVRSREGSWHELTQGRQIAQVDAAGQLAEEIARSTPPAGRYDRVRVEFFRVEARVTSAPPGQGIPGDGTVEIDFEGEPSILVERPVQLEIDGADRRVRIDLRSQVWLRAAVLPRVPPSTFRNAVRVSVLP